MCPDWDWTCNPGTRPDGTEPTSPSFACLVNFLKSVHFEYSNTILLKSDSSTSFMFVVVYVGGVFCLVTFLTISVKIVFFVVCDL